MCDDIVGGDDVWVVMMQVKAEIRHLLLASIGDRERRLRATIVWCLMVLSW